VFRKNFRDGRNCGKNGGESVGGFALTYKWNFYGRYVILDVFEFLVVKSSDVLFNIATILK
jgi:hypothetical protein